MNKALKKYAGWLMPLLIVPILIACLSGYSVSEPGVPTNIRALEGNAEVTVTWMAPTNTGRIGIADYKVYWADSSSVTTASTDTASTEDGNTTELTIPSLNNGTMYYFIVTATNSAGESIASMEVSATPFATFPGAPTNVAAASGGGEVTVSWTAPSDTGRATITDYTVYWADSVGVTTASADNLSTEDGNTTELTITPLNNGTTYYFIVTATNSAGDSVASTEVSATPTTVPDAPTNVAAESEAEGGKVTVSWTAPTDTDGVGITDYTVYWSTSADVTTASTDNLSTGNGNTTELTIPSLNNGTAYYFIVTATNSVGESAASTKVSATPAITVPDAPTGVEAVAGDAEVIVSWTAPSDTGRAPITDYTVYWSTSADVTTASTDNLSTGNGNTTELTITPLINDTMYYFIVTATNSAGESVALTAVSAIPAKYRGANYRDMVTVPGGTFDQTTIGLKSFSHTITGFKMARYEVTYDLWHAVHQWAIKNGYTFANAGREGNDGGEGVVPTPSKYEPVTSVNWRDSIVWCNAYSEMSDLGAVYKTAGGAVIKDSTDSNGTVCDTAVPDWGATGFRLPTTGEWLYAATYKDGKDWTPPSYASGASDDYQNPDATKAVAWYDANSGRKTQIVGTKMANQLGIHDMSGNVWEWCWNWDTVSPTTQQSDYRGPDSPVSGSFRLHMGGSWYNWESSLRLGPISRSLPEHEGYTIGLRLVRASSELSNL